ncbi:transporter substrate-binding domain-containing protein [bacterium]|nr:transporter substrate-binding domain-containing protein [bacterium]
MSRILSIAFLVVYLSLMPKSYAQGESDMIVAAVLANWPPQYLTDNETGKPTGFAVDIFDEIAQRAHIKVNYRVYQ